MIVTLVVFCSVLILSRASINGSPETPRVNMTFHDGEISKLIKRQQKEIVEGGYKIKPYKQYLSIVNHKKQQIPEFFDARKKWPMCKSISQIKHQGTCRTSWAISTAMVTTDRLCISSQGKELFNVSEQDLLTCCKKCFPNNSSINQCNDGASLLLTLVHMIEDGVVSTDCKPYKTATLQDGCKTHCEHETTPYKKVKIPFISLGRFDKTRPLSLPYAVQNMQIEIMKNGPVASQLQFLPFDFNSFYTNEVYINWITRSHLEGKHVIRVLGWGTENSIPYWLCANTRGQKWGKLGGFFKIRRGTNELGIEESFIAANMDLKTRIKIENDNAQINKPAGNIKSGSSSRKTLRQIYKITAIVVIIIYF